MLSDAELESTIRRAILLFNRLKSPQATAKLVLASKAMITISFTGGFCYGCGVMDYVDSFASQFKAVSSKFELKVGKTRQVNPRSFEADFNLKAK